MPSDPDRLERLFAKIFAPHIIKKYQNHRRDHEGQFSKCLFDVVQWNNGTFLAFRQIVLPFFERDEGFQFVIDICRDDFVRNTPPGNVLNNLYPAVDFTPNILLLNKFIPNRSETVNVERRNINITVEGNKDSTDSVFLVPLNCRCFFLTLLNLNANSATVMSVLACFGAIMPVFHSATTRRYSFSASGVPWIPK